MTRLKHFLGGLLLGAVAMFCALRYHVVRYADGVVVVDRTLRPALSSAYADIRDWSAGEWLDHADVSAALVEDGYGNLIAQTSVDNVVDALDQTLPSLKAFSESASPGDRQPPPLPLPRYEDSFPGDAAARPSVTPPAHTVPAPIIPEITEIFVDEPVSQRRSAPLPQQPIAAAPEPTVRPTSSSATSIPAAHTPAAARPSPMDWLHHLFDAVSEDAAPPAAEPPRTHSGGLNTQHRKAPAPPASPETVAISPPPHPHSAAQIRRDLSAIDIPVLKLDVDSRPNAANPLARRQSPAPPAPEDAPLWEVQPF